MMRMLSTIAIVLAISAPALAKNGGDKPENVPYAVKARCDTLAQKFDAAQASATTGDVQAARDTAAQGSALCRAGRYEEGGDTLANALRLIGAPAD